MTHLFYNENTFPLCKNEVFVGEVFLNRLTYGKRSVGKLMEKMLPHYSVPPQSGLSSESDRKHLRCF